MDTLQLHGIRKLASLDSLDSIRQRKFAGARILSGVALIVSLETLQLTVQPYLYEEGGAVQGFLAAPHIGLFCWIGSMAVIWFSSTARLNRSAPSTIP